MEVENLSNLQVTTPYKEDLDYAKYSQSKDSSILKIRKNILL